MISSIFDLVAKFRTKLNLKNLSYLPRWTILLIDTFVVLFSIALTTKIFKGIGLYFFDISYVYLLVPLFLAVNVFFFWLFRTYSGIIRHSSYIDAVKIFVSVGASTFSMSVINYTYYAIYDDKLLLSTGLFVNFILSFSGLFFYRILVKQTFDIYLAEIQSQDLVSALIYGSDANAISVANALRTEKPLRFKIVGFVDERKQNASKRILNLPIYNVRKKIPVLMRSTQAQALIIADKALSKEKELSIVDDCLEFNLKVFTVPLITDWDDSNDISQKVTNFKIEDLLDRDSIVIDSKSVSNQLNNKTVLITGAAGSIGSEIVRQALSFNPKKVVILDQAETPLHQLRLELEKMETKVRIETIICDIRNKQALEDVFRIFNPKIVFHAAAYKHVPLMEENPAQAIFVNVMGTKNAADLSIEYNVESFVMVSTDKAVNPSNVMGASKRIAEKYVQSLHYKHIKNARITKFITTRFGNVLGSNGSVVPLFTSQIANGGPITITHPDIIRYFMTIPEACQLVLEAGAMGNGGEIFIFDMGKPVKIIDLANKMIRLAGYTPNKEIKIEVVGLRPGEKLYEELLNKASKTLPTHHKMIMIAQEEYFDFEAIINDVDSLILISETFLKNDIVQKMKNIVPEFVSMNSYYEALDN
jgi:FlaA1/EpsC-like NDP-sugar epimerase